MKQSFVIVKSKINIFSYIYSRFVAIFITSLIAFWRHV